MIYPTPLTIVCSEFNFIFALPKSCLFLYAFLSLIHILCFIKNNSFKHKSSDDELLQHFVTVVWSNAGDLGLILGLGRSPGEGKGNPLQYSGLENSMDCIVPGVTKSQTRLSDFHLCFISSLDLLDNFVE